jgi:hypothetical protein
MSVKRTNEGTKHAKMYKCLRAQDFALVILTGRVNGKNGTAADKFIKEQAKVIGQQVGAPNL